MSVVLPAHKELKRNTVLHPFSFQKVTGVLLDIYQEKNSLNLYKHQRALKT